MTIPIAGGDNSKLPAGGVFTNNNLSLYHYANNNPVKYTDPTGMFDFDTNTVEPGDTLNQIATDCNERYGTNYTAEDLQKLNPNITDVNKIYVGDNLNLGITNQFEEFNYNDNSIYESLSFSLKKTGDILGYVSIGLNLVSTAFIFSGNIAVAECLDIAAAGCDILATGLYYASGDNEKAAISLAATIMDFVPGPYKFNKGANRFISSSTGRFVSTKLGKQAMIIPKTYGIGLNVISNIN